MKFSKSKWLAYTFLVGLIPVLTRVLTWAITTKGIVSPFAATDFIAFGLVLHISIVNELEHLPAKEKDWRTVQNGTSLIFITLYSALYAISLIGEKSGNMVDATVLLTSCIVFSAVSTLLSLSVFHRLSKLSAR